MRNFLIILFLTVISCKTVNTSHLDREVKIDNTQESTKILEYKQLVESYGDTAVTYDGDLIILGDRSYVSLGTTAWINRKVVLIYK